MDNMVITLKNVSKSYRMYSSPSDKLKELIHPFKKKYHRDFWALHNVSFDVKKGDTIGIIGRNGSGKSTLLKVLCGVLQPTSGEVSVKGRISALLELGAGFNPEFTGRDNVYMNGAIMGISKEEMDKRFDDIAAFADIGDFIDQPVKTYSSGMYVRLAFACAINVDPDILIVDEALAVGDVFFQYKCYQKIKEIKERGTTIFFVTHSTAHLSSFCNRAFMINEGRIHIDSHDVNLVIAEYEKSIRNIMTEAVNAESIDDKPLLEEDFRADPAEGEQRFGNFRAVIKDVLLTKNLENRVDAVDIYSGENVYLKFVIYSRDEFNDIVLTAVIKEKTGVTLWGENNIVINKPLSLQRGRNEIVYEFKANLNAGEYILMVGLVNLKNGVREELDHRWPIKKINISSRRESIGMVYSTLNIMVREGHEYKYV